MTSLVVIETVPRTYVLPRAVQAESGVNQVQADGLPRLTSGSASREWVRKLTDKVLCPDGTCPDTGWYALEDASNPDLLIGAIRADDDGYSRWTNKGWAPCQPGVGEIRLISKDLAADVVVALTAGCCGLLLRPTQPRAWLVAGGKEWSTESRDKAAKKHEALPDGSYPIHDKADLKRAIQSFGRAKDKDKVKRHIIKRARALKAVDTLPKDWGVTAAAAPGTTDADAGVAFAIVDDLDTDAVIELIRILEGPKVERYENGTWIEDAAMLASLQSVNPPALVELDAEKLAQVKEQVDAYDAEHKKPGEPGTTAAGGPPKGGNAETLRRYWASGKGAVKIRWGTPGDFKRCVKQVNKYMPGRAEGYCANLHKRSTGEWPGKKKGGRGMHAAAEPVFVADPAQEAGAGNQIPVVDTAEDLKVAVTYAKDHPEARWYVRKRMSSIHGFPFNSWDSVVAWFDKQNVDSGGTSHA